MANDKKRFGFYDAEGNKLPGISTILGKFQDPGGLINWAWKVGAEGRSLKDAREDASSLGHLSVARALGIISDQAVDMAGLPADRVYATNAAIAAFERWAHEHDFKLLEYEIPLVSETLRFGGNVTVAEIDGRPWIFSLKAGSGVYREDLLTASAQAFLTHTSGRMFNVPPRAHFVRFGKDSGGFDLCVGVEDLMPAWRMFEHILNAYNCLDVLNGILKGAA